MKVLILSKTYMNNGKCCVGGITQSGRYVRLLTPTGENQPENTRLQIRDIWNIEFDERPFPNPPHIEDVTIKSVTWVEKLGKHITIRRIIEHKKIVIWVGSPDVLFEGKLQWTSSGSGFINRSAIPEHSVGFWLPDRDLIKDDFNGVTRYYYSRVNGRRAIKFVGFEKPISRIPAGVLVRVSLARWWKQDSQTEERCYLQLSGWYDYEESL